MRNFFKQLRSITVELIYLRARHALNNPIWSFSFRALHYISRPLKLHRRFPVPDLAICPDGAIRTPVERLVTRLGYTVEILKAPASVLAFAYTFTTSPASATNLSRSPRRQV